MNTSTSRADSFDWSHALNVLALYGVSGILLFAFVWQFAFNELPCPLCLLQRAAFVLVGIGFFLNVRFGASSLHYGLVLLGAVGGMVASGRQVLLHIAPGDPGFGSPFLGMHFYTWALIAFIAVIVFCAIMLIIDRHRTDQATVREAAGLAVVAMWLFFALTVGNLVSTTLECGLGPCADDPVAYELLQR